MYLCRESILGCSHLQPSPCPCLCPCLVAVHRYCGCAGRQLQQIETNSLIGVRIAIEIGFAWAGLGRCKCHPPLFLSSPRWGLIAQPPLASHICAFICVCVRCVLLIIVDGVDLMQKAANSVDAGSDASSGQRGTRLLDLACH